MDAANTLQIPRSVVSAIDDRGDPEATMVVPAIAQEASTQVLASPHPRRPQQEDVHTPPMGWAPPITQAPPPEPEQVDGLVPTVKPAPHPRSTLSQRLDG
jgi:hypothetical protein